MLSLSELWRMWISGSWILNKESDFWNGLDNETAWLFLVMNWLLKKEFHLLLSCLLESGLSYGLDDWRRKVIVTAMVLMIEGGCSFCFGKVLMMIIKNGYLLSSLGSIVIPKLQLLILCYERVNVYLTLLMRMGSCHGLNCEGKWFLKWSWYWNRRAILAKSWILKKVKFHLLWSCLVYDDIYGLDIWRV